MLFPPYLLSHFINSVIQEVLMDKQKHNKYKSLFMLFKFKINKKSNIDWNQLKTSTQHKYMYMYMYQIKL